MTRTYHLSPQADLMLSHLLRGAVITSLYAHLTLGISDTTRTIRDLRAAKYPIKDEWRVDNHNRRYKAYWIEQNGED